jgi:CubicO group peptidase (beta-lactamase class C family)
VLLRISGIGALVLALTLLMSLLAGWAFMKPVSSNPDQELTYRVNELIGTGKPVKSIVLRVATGDGLYTWAGAAGVANENSDTPMTVETPIYIASVTKLFTATAVMRLYEEGALSLDDTLDKYLPEQLIGGIHVYQGRDYSHEITIRQLLSQTSGLPDYYEDKAADGASVFELLMANPDRNWTVDETVARARDQMTPHFAPGVSAYYSDTNYQLLGKIIESVTGQPLYVVFDEFFFQPLHLEHTWLVGSPESFSAAHEPVADVFDNQTNITRIRSNTAFWADGGIVSTTDDMITFLKALNTGGIVRNDTLHVMHSWRQLQNMPFEYGYGMMYFSPGPSATTLLGVTPLSSVATPKTWGHTGSVGSFLYYSEDLDLYMAGSIDQTQDNLSPIILMSRAMRAVRQFRS